MPLHISVTRGQHGAVYGNSTKTLQVQLAWFHFQISCMTENSGHIAAISPVFDACYVNVLGKAQSLQQTMTVEVTEHKVVLAPN